MKLKISIFLILLPLFILGQTLDYESITKSKSFKLSGVVSANAVYYNSNQNSNREPFTYYLQGTLTASIYSFSIPVSYSYSNQGENLDYKLPFNFNRISLHPKYKWVLGHIGSVSMTFSPYTLSGHQFTGGGIELTPKGPFKISAMSGRLLKATEDDGDSRTIPAFNRMGYGVKTSYEKERYKIGVIGFYAKDDLNSISIVPEEKGVLPKENLVVSFEGDVKITQSLSVRAEYASTAITNDLRADDSENAETNLAGILFNSKTSTAYYSALKAGLNYNINRGSVGINYERIEPGYETLGAYYFNNDFENITLNAASAFFNNKLSLSFNVGYQRDDLKNKKANSTNRTVGSVNANLTLSDKLNLTGSYSNFTTFTNIKPNQFDVINDDNLLDNEAENLDYKQLSQSANLSINWSISNEKTSQQSLNINYALNDVSNEQGGIVRIGDASTFHNLNGGYRLGFPEKDIDINAAVNYTYNTIGKENGNTWGPTLSFGKRFFEKTLNARLSATYSKSTSIAGVSNITNFRANATYIFKERHNFSLTAVQLFRSGSNKSGLSELTATLGYNYAFGFKKPKINFNREDKNHVKINYRDKVFEGNRLQVTKQILDHALDMGYDKMLRKKKSELDILEVGIKVSESKPKKVYKESIYEYLESLYGYVDFVKKYDELVRLAHEKLVTEGENADSQIEKEYADVNTRISKAEIPDPLDLEDAITIEKKHSAHKKMLNEIRKLDIENIESSESDLKGFKKRYFSKVYVMYQNGKSEQSIINYLEVRMADIYHRLLNE